MDINRIQRDATSVKGGYEHKDKYRHDPKAFAHYCRAIAIDQMTHYSYRRNRSEWVSHRENGIGQYPFPLVSSYGDESGNLLDESNVVAFADALRSTVPAGFEDTVDIGEPDGLHSVDMFFPLFPETVEMVLELLGALEQYPVLDESDWSEREYEATAQYFDNDWTYILSEPIEDNDEDDIADHIGNLQCGGHDDLADAILSAAFYAGTEQGYCDNFSPDAANEGAREAIAYFVWLAAERVRTSNGAQVELFERSL